MTVFIYLFIFFKIYYQNFNGKKKKNNKISHHLHHAVKCSLKANESYLYPLDKSFLFIPKPPTLIAHSEIASVTFSRVGRGMANTRTFEMKFNMKNGVDYQFGGINRLVLIIKSFN